MKKTFGDMAEFKIGQRRTTQNTMKVELMIHGKVINATYDLDLYDELYTKLFDFCNKSISNFKPLKEVKQ